MTASELQKIGPYKILATLGRGGMGVVYRGQHESTGEPAAVKAVRVPHESLLASIRREIDALARVQHPGIVRILAAGAQDGLPWYAMELLDGLTLRAYGQKLKALRAALNIVRRICAPLAFLHGEGLVHCDLKPDNILICGDDRPVLVDFGLMSQFSARENREALDIGEFMAGTLNYMAPEQLRGEFVDARADIYSLGCILYELVTGELPYAGNSAAQLLSARANSRLRRPAQIVSGLPAELDELIMRMLAEDPVERIGYAADVAAALLPLCAPEQQTGKLPRSRDYLYRSRFYGRTYALHKINRALTRLKSRKGGLVLIGGESGIGKTRLAIEVARTAKYEALTVLTGECAQPLQSTGKAQSSAPLQALKRPLQLIADHCREYGRAETEKLLGPRGKLLARYEPALADLPGQDSYPEPAELPGDAARRRLFEYIAETFNALAREKPLLLIIDDLHWADDLTLGLLEFLVSEGGLSRMSLLVLGLYRSESISAELRQLTDSKKSLNLMLGRLKGSALASMVGDMLAIKAPPPAFVQFLERQSEGNPFFVAEYLQAVVRAGLIYRDGRGYWQIAEQGASERVYENWPIPGSLRGILLQRLNGLSDTASRLVALASVFGREVESRLLARAARISEQQLFTELDEMLRGQIMAEADGRVRFTHDQLREIAYAQIASEQRNRLHHTVAESIEALRTEARDEHLGVLAYHWEQAGNVGKAQHYYLAAARQALSLYAPREAERLYRAYLGFIEYPTPEGIKARYELGANVLRYSGRIKEAISEIKYALMEAEILGDLSGQAMSLQGLGNIHIDLGELENALDFYQRAHAIYVRRDDRHGQALALSGIGITDWFQGRFAEACNNYERAVTMLREVGDRRFEGITLNRLAIIKIEQDELAEAQSIMERALALLIGAGDRRNQATVLTNIGMINIEVGRLTVAANYMEQALSLAREIGDRLIEGIPLLNLANIRREQGCPAAAAQLYEEALTIFRQIGDQLNQSETICSMATLARQAHGDYARAQQLAESALAITKKLKSAHNTAACLCELGHVALAQGRSAHQELTEAEALVAGAHLGNQASIGKAIAKLTRAVNARTAGTPLYRGECREDFPVALMKWIREEFTTETQR